jgi:hypothetical protein
MRLLLLLLLLLFQPIQAFHNPTGRVASPAAHRTFQQPKTIVVVTSSKTVVPTSLVTLRGGAGGSELVELAYNWCMSLGQPAALVAGAVVATLYDNIRGAGELEVQPDDALYVKYVRKMTTFLLMTAFALQIICIFVTTVTGTMLLSQVPFENTVVTTAMGYLREHFEFEYLTCRITFLQGLLNWLGAVALEHTIPRKEGEGKAATKMNNFIASSILTLIVLLISFYNNHMTFYQNYLHMLWRWAQVAFVRYVGHWPPRPLAFAYVPSTIITLVLLVKATIRNEPSKQKK